MSPVGLDSMTKKVLTTMLFFLPYNKVYSWTSMEVLFAENINTVYQITHSTGLQPPWKREERWKEKQWDCWGYIGNPRRCKAPPETRFFTIISIIIKSHDDYKPCWHCFDGSTDAMLMQQVIIFTKIFIMIWSIDHYPPPPKPAQWLAWFHRSRSCP